MSTAAKFDAYQGVNFPFRMLQGVSAEALTKYCEEKGYAISATHRVGLSTFDAFLVKASKESAK